MFSINKNHDSSTVSIFDTQKRFPVASHFRVKYAVLCCVALAGMETPIAQAASSQPVTFETGSVTLVCQRASTGSILYDSCQGMNGMSSGQSQQTSVSSQRVDALNIPTHSQSSQAGSSSVSGQVPVSQLVSQSSIPAKVEVSFTFGSTEERLVSCSEWNANFLKGSFLGLMTNPHNVPGSQKVSFGEVLAVADEAGWYATKLYGAGGKFLGYGGAVVNRMPAYLNGVFHHWVNGDSNDGWNPAKVGTCEAKISG